MLSSCFVFYLTDKPGEPPTTIEEMETLVREFWMADMNGRQDIVMKAQNVVENESDARKDVAKNYVKTMQKIIEKGDDFVDKEAAHVEKLTTGVISDTKRQHLTDRANVLTVFQHIKVNIDKHIEKARKKGKKKHSDNDDQKPKKKHTDDKDRKSKKKHSDDEVRKSKKKHSDDDRKSKKKHSDDEDRKSKKGKKKKTEDESPEPNGASKKRRKSKGSIHSKKKKSKKD